MYAAYGVLGALIERQRTGRGRRLEVNMLESSMAFIQDGFTAYTMTGILGGRQTRITRSQAFAFRCADGRLIGMHLSTTEKFWQELARALGAPELIEDERFRTHQARVKNYDVLRDILAGRFALKPRGEWLAALEAHDVPVAPIHTVADALDDPQVVALGTMVEMRHPTEGKVTSVHCPLLVDGKRPLSEMRAPPTIGEQTDEVLAALGIVRKAG
jgi:formyl-CoA transferase